MPTLGMPRMPVVDWRRLVTPVAAAWLAAIIAVAGHNADELVSHPLDPDIRDVLTWPSSATGMVEDQITGAAIETPAPPQLSDYITWLNV